MENEILSNLNNPRQLERLYRNDRNTFKRSFEALAPRLPDSPLATFWHERLTFADEISWGTRRDLMVVAIVAAVAAILVKVPNIFPVDEDFFYPRNLGFIVFPGLMAYFAWKNNLPTAKIIFIVVPTVLAAVFINMLPDLPNSDTVILSCIHVVLFLWYLLGYAFVAGDRKNEGKWLGFLRYNGELLVITALIAISGGLLTAITIGLFSLIGYQIEEYWFNYVVIFGMAAAPIIGTYLTQSNPQLVGKVSPVIAKIFSPLVLAMLVLYLVAIAYSGKDPYNDRQFLIFFNGLLIGVMAIIFFSIAESSKSAQRQLENWVLFLLSFVTILVNGVALSAIAFRISEWGITPNRAAVLGSNTLILIHLVIVTAHLFRVIARKKDIAEVGGAIASYLPVYFIWTIIVTFLFPMIFGT